MVFFLCELALFLIILVKISSISQLQEIFQVL